MADDVDMANDKSQRDIDMALLSARNATSKIPKGNPGECLACETWNGRLVHSYCSPCRDKYNLP